jgi:hypothetical protein
MITARAQEPSMEQLILSTREIQKMITLRPHTQMCGRILHSLCSMIAILDQMSSDRIDKRSLIFSTWKGPRKKSKRSKMKKQKMPLLNITTSNME